MRTLPRDLLFLAVLLAVAAPVFAQRGHSTRPLRVRFVLDGPHPKLLAIRNQIANAIADLLGDRRPIDLSAAGDYVASNTLASAQEQLDRALDSEESDLLVALGAMSGVAVGRRSTLPRPVIVPYTLEPQLAGLPFEAGRSGQKNLAYIEDGLDVAAALKRFHEVHRVPQLHVLLGDDVARAAPGMVLYLRSLSDAVGAQVEVIQTAETRAAAIVNDLPGEVRGLFVSPLAHLEPGQFPELLRLANARRLPIFAFGGRDACEQGALGSVTSERDHLRRARRTAGFVERYLDGESLADFEVSFIPTEALYLNVHVAEQTGVRPDWITLTEAELVGFEPMGSGETLTLGAALQLVVDHNLDLRAANAQVASADEDVKLARAPLLPQASLNAGAAWIDADRSQAPQTPGQLSANWGGTVSQLLYSPRRFGNLEVHKHGRDAVAFGRDTTRLDVILQAGEAYVFVLRALAALRVQRENLALTRANLQRARLRVRVGRSSEAEVLRWRTSLTNAQNAVLVAFGQLQATELELNRVLNRPLSSKLQLSEVDRSASELLARPDGVEGESLIAYLHDPWSFGTLTDFLAEEGVRNSPEVQQLQAAISAQRRRLERTRESLFVPDVSAGVTVTHNYADTGGQNPRDLPMGAIDDVDVEAGIQATLPLSLGGQRYAGVRQARAEMLRLERQQQSIALRVEQAVRTEMAALAPAFANIELSRRASEAADRSLELVNSAYLAGSTDIVRVLDAQAQAINARLSAATAMYALMTRILRAERRAGRFRYFAGDAERAEFLERLAQFAVEHAHASRRQARTPSPEHN